MITTTHRSNTEALRAIMALYCPTGFDADVTFSRGLFYQDGIPVPPLRFDIAPQVEGVVQADCRRLPLERRSVGSLICDLPFIHHPGKQSRMGNRFSGFFNQKELQACYREAMVEFWRVLKPGGIVAWKNQDIIEGSRQKWTHCLMWAWATEIGFEVVDLFVQVNDRVLRGHNHAKQQHARKTHAFWWVFQKPAGKRRSFAEGLV